MSSTLHVSTHAEIVGAIPSVLGFHPAESLVLLGARDGNRVHFATRHDLPAPSTDLAAFAQASLLHHIRQRAGRVIVAVYTDAGDPDEGTRHYQDLVDALVTAAELMNVVVDPALYVYRDRIWCYSCRECPVETRDLAAEERAVTAFALDGRALVATRADVAASITPTSEVELAGAELVEAETIKSWLITPDESRLDDAQVAATIVSTRMHHVRDGLVALVADDPRQVLPQLLDVVRRCPTESLPPVGTVAACVAYLVGDGTLAQALLERVLSADPNYRLALYVHMALGVGMHPNELRTMMTTKERP